MVSMRINSEAAKVKDEMAGCRDETNSRNSFKRRRN